MWEKQTKAKNQPTNQQLCVFQKNNNLDFSFGRHNAFICDCCWLFCRNCLILDMQLWWIRLVEFIFVFRVVVWLIDVRRSTKLREKRHLFLMWNAFGIFFSFAANNHPTKQPKCRKRLKNHSFLMRLGTLASSVRPKKKEVKSIWVRRSVCCVHKLLSP